GKAFFGSLYTGAPYGIPTNGTEDSLPLISTAQVRAVHQRYYVASSMVVAMICAIERSDDEQIALELDAQLPAGTSAEALPTPPPLAQASRQHIEFPSSQTHVMVGGIGVKRGDPDWYALHVGNEILGGGGFASRLNQVIRQDHGLV